MASCTLELGGRIVARAEGGPFDGEYALFEAHEIELRSNNEPGTVREHGYRTTVELALERLEGDGVTPALAAAAADALGSLVTAYALGPEVRRVASLLSAAELFEGRAWHAGTKQYEGAWLDVAALATDSGVAGAARALQLLHLVALLAELPPESGVYLCTSDYTTGRRPGERTHRRVSLATVRDLPAVIGALAETSSTRAPRDGGPSRAELLEGLRARLAARLLERSRASLEAIARALSVRERPQRGPLADADLWALELQLSEGDTTDAVEKIDALERSRGRQPGTAYLRARVALLLGSEDPRQIAERASALAMSMSSFAELELVAAEAWMRAGDRKRALAYAHDLADNPQVDSVVRARARTLLEPPVAEPPKPDEATERASARPTPDVSSVPAHARSPVGDFFGGSPTPFEESSPPPSSQRATPSETSPSESAPMVSITAGLRTSAPPPRVSPSSRGPSAPPAATTSSRPPIADVIASDRPIAPTPIVSIGHGASSHSSPPPRDPVPSSVAPASMPTRPSIPAARGPSAAPPPTSAPRTSVAAPPPPTDDGDDDPIVVRGASRPPFVSEAPPTSFPAAPLVPRFEPNQLETAETLSLPPGLHGESGASEPTNALEARIYFTHRTRELGRLYRQRHDVELRMDLRSVEIVQRHLAERFETGKLESFDDVVEVRLHAAFLSELLARRLGAEWTDVAVSEMGYWAMNVPPGTTVWPIGRVLRFVSMQYRERDLVSYFLELQARAHGLK